MDTLEETLRPREYRISGYPYLDSLTDRVIRLVNIPRS